jgi:hypothetical protein
MAAHRADKGPSSLCALTCSPRRLVLCAAAVERFVEGHAGGMTIWELEGAADDGGGGFPAAAAPPRDRASLLLQFGLRSAAGGNAAAAEHRLCQCRDQLLVDLAAAQPQAQPPRCPVGVDAEAGVGLRSAAAAEIRGRLGAVYGCLGDGARSGGDLAAALSWYEDSAEQLRRAERDSPEVSAHARRHCSWCCRPSRCTVSIPERSRAYEAAHVSQAFGARLQGLTFSRFSMRTLTLPAPLRRRRRRTGRPGAACDAQQNR